MVTTVKKKTIKPGVLQALQQYTTTLHIRGFQSQGQRIWNITGIYDHSPHVMRCPFLWLFRKVLRTRKTQDILFIGEHLVGALCEQ